MLGSCNASLIHFSPQYSLQNDRAKFPCTSVDFYCLLYAVERPVYFYICWAQIHYSITYLAIPNIWSGKIGALLIIPIFMWHGCGSLLQLLNATNNSSNSRFLIFMAFANIFVQIYKSSQKLFPLWEISTERFLVFLFHKICRSAV